jgi:hypothetical protein
MCLWQKGKSKTLIVLGIMGATAMTIAAASSTPLMAWAAGIFALFLWPIRKQMRAVRWGIVITLIGLQTVMKAPVWFIITRMEVVGGSSGYHRAQLIDTFIRHFGDWWLVGARDTGSWGWDMWDVQNQFVMVGETGGLLALVLFIGLFYGSFGHLGRARKLVDGDLKQEWFLWCIGASILANVVGFFGVNYFDQSRVVWLSTLAIVIAATNPILSALTVNSGEASTLDFTRPLSAKVSPLISRIPSKPKVSLNVDR